MSTASGPREPESDPMRDGGPGASPTPPLPPGVPPPVVEPAHRPSSHPYRPQTFGPAHTPSADGDTPSLLWNTAPRRSAPDSAPEPATRNAGQPWAEPVGATPHRVDDQYGFVPPKDTKRTSPMVWVIVVGGILLLVALLALLGLLAARLFGMAEQFVGDDAAAATSVPADPGAAGTASGAAAAPGAVPSPRPTASDGTLLPREWADSGNKALDLSQSRGQLTGDGSDVVDLPDGTTDSDIVAYGFEGGTFAIVTALDAAGADLVSVTSGTPPFSGVGTLEIDPLSEGDARQLRIDAEGSWTIDVLPVEAAPLWDGASALSGEGDAVVRLRPGTARTVQFTHDGESNVVIWTDPIEWGSMQLLVNEIGAVDMPVEIPAPVSALTLEADGSWTLTP